MMNITEFKDLLFKKAEKEGFEEYETYSMKTDSFSVTIFKGEIEKYKKNIAVGVGFRCILNGKTGYAYTEDLSDEAADFIIKEASANSEIADPEETADVFEGCKSYPTVEGLYNPYLSDVSDGKKIETAKELEKAAYAYSEKIEQVTSCTVGSGETETLIANSKGLNLSQRVNLIYASINVTAADGGRKKTGSDIWAGNRLEKLDKEKLVKTACDNAITALTAKTVKGYTGKVIFKNEAFSDILETFLQNFFAELAQKGFSLLKDREGEKIAGDAVTIVDEPLLKYGYASTAFDSEGVASKNKTVVEKGVLKTLLYNLKSAKKAGVESTGNGFKTSYKGQVQTYPTNFYLKNGELPYPDLVKSLENGVIITSVSGLHAGANPVSGDFSLLSEGFLVENGKITRPADQITCAGNFYSLLKNITLLSDDLKFSVSGIGSPSLIADGITISGE
ncbi:MAG: TldD/PmbA family protein [Clostridiales bacterium]|nr:TldD/PmbA family protein [Clostridiales bacterium]